MLCDTSRLGEGNMWTKDWFDTLVIVIWVSVWGVIAYSVPFSL